MESGFLNSCRGQLAIEFMLLVVVIIMFVHAVIIPSVDISAGAVEDTTRLAQAKFAAERIANAIEYVAASPGDARQTIHVFVPERASVNCGASVIGFEAEMSEKLSGYPPSSPDCNHEISVCGLENYCCKDVPVSAAFSGTLSMDGAMLYEVVVNKSAGAINVYKTT